MTTRERPVIFTGESVRAILAGRKTMTRRVVKVQPPVGFDHVVTMPISTETAWKNDAMPTHTFTDELWENTTNRPPKKIWLHCPYGRVGDRLWVRESWGLVATEKTAHFARNEWLDGDATFLRADRVPMQVVYRADQDCHPGPWRSPIFMPRWASRLTLEIVSVRVERLQTVTEADAIAEGFNLETCERYLTSAGGGLEPVEAYYGENAKGVECDGWMCRNHAERFAGKKGHVGWGCTPETDGPAMCEKCGVPLIVSLSKYGIERELHIEVDPDGKEPKYFAPDRTSAAIAAMIAGGIGDLQPEHHGRLAQIAYAAAWDTINGKRHPWSESPWVFAISFRQVPASRLPAAGRGEAGR